MWMSVYLIIAKTVLEALYCIAGRLDDIKVVKQTRTHFECTSHGNKLLLHKRGRLAKDLNTIIREPPSLISSIRRKVSPVVVVNYLCPNMLAQAVDGVC